MLRWKLEASNPTTAADLKSVLEATRDEWVRVTPQVSLVTAGDYEDLDALIAQKYDADRAPVVAKKASKVASHNAAGLDKWHLAAIRQMNAAIAAVCAVVATMPEGSHVTVSLTGHFWPGNREYLDERYSMTIDQCRPPVDVP